MYIRFKDGKSKAFTLSYDDAVMQDIRLVDIFNKHNLKCTFNIPSGFLAPEDYQRKELLGQMKLSEAIELYKNGGHEIAAHGFKHKSLAEIGDGEATYDTIHDREILEKAFGRVVRGMAYANGSYSEHVAQIVKNCGIVYSRTTDATGYFGLPQNWLFLNPTCHHNDKRLFTLADTFVNSTPKLREVWLFYVWGHSYEFDNDDNWDIIEKFAQTIGGHDDVWYATNIEIYDYVQAFKRLVVSLDEKIITNPNSIDVWVQIDSETICIKAGETVYR